MACQCGGCSGGEGGVRDAGFADLSVTVEDGAGAGACGCRPPLARLEEVARRAGAGDVTGAASVLSVGNFSALRCWPLWTWLAALLVLAWWRS